ncbi:MAG: hypothetical protein IPK56_11670 [Elusimicrobia bacterium]|nr:hypothetical protein [Elusimicrobiota bacterium]
MGKEKDGWEIMAGRKPEFDIPPDGYETAPVAVADDAPPDGYEGPSTGYKGVGASGSWDQPQPAVVPQPVVPHIQMPQNPDAMSTYKEALTAYLVGNRDLAKAKAEAALSLDTGLTEAKNMLTRMRVNPLAGTNAPRPEYPPQNFTDYTVGQMAADTYNAIDQSPVVRTLGSGVARIGAGLSRVPNLAANIFALPYNTIVTLTGNEDMAQRSPKMFEKEARWWDEKATQLSEGFRRWGSKGEDFVSVAKRKDPGEIASYIAYKVLEEAPQQAIVIGTTMAGIPAAGLSYMGASSSAQELAATPENVNPAAATVNAIVNGTVEAALEQTPALMGKWSKAIEEAVGKKGRGEVIKAVAKTIGSSIVQEGLVEEAPTEYLQSASRVMTGVDPNAMQGVGGRMIEAATIGGAMGGGMTAPAAIGSGIQMGAGKLGPGDFPPDGFNENNTPQGPIPPSSIGQSVAPLDIKQNPNYSLGDESARLAGSSDSVVNVPGVLDLRRGADAPVVPADRVLPSAMPADANIPAPVQSPGNYERVALPQSPAIPNLEQPAPAESQSALPQPPQLDQQQPKYQAEPEKASVFYSQLQRTLNEKMPNAAPVAMVRNLIDPAKGNVKAEEVEWSGINEWLLGKEKVTKAEVLDFLKQNQVEVKEVVKDDTGGFRVEPDEDNSSLFNVIANNRQGTQVGEISVLDGAFKAMTDSGRESPEFASMERAIAWFNEERPIPSTKFSNYQIPGGENYREVLLTLPARQRNVPKGEADKLNAERPPIGAPENEINLWWDKVIALDKKYGANQPELDTFESTHFDEPNILAHVRMNDRTTADGKKVLFIEEVQSDWHQKGREEGYQDKKRLDLLDDKLKRDGKLSSEEQAEYRRLTDLESFSASKGGVPNAPFKKTWHELALKRMLRWAVDNGYDGIAWTTGEQQAERYDLSKQVGTIQYSEVGNTDPADPREFEISVFDKNENNIIDKSVTERELPDIVGKEIAKKILAGEGVDSQLRTPRGGVVEVKKLSGGDLKVGGEGMKGFYDQIIPSFLNKYTKKWGGRVGESEIQTGKIVRIPADYRGPLRDRPTNVDEPKMTTVHHLEITPAMRESVAQGQPMFQADRPTSGTTEGQSEALTAFNKIISANKMTDAVFAELVDSIKVDRAAFRKGYGTEYSADKFAIRGATYPIRNHPTIRALVRFAKGAHQGTGYHEAMHVIFNNVLTAQERQVLMDKFGTEEQAAEAFARYEAKRTGMEKPSRIRAIFDKILELLGQLRSYMSGKGWKTANDVMRSVEEGRTERRRAAGRGEAKYQAEKQKDQTETEAFKRWFGDSVVTDTGKPMSQGGKPLVVYHGTSEKGLSGDAFNKDFLGAVTKSRSAKAGFYFVANKDAAAGYSRLANSKPVQDLIDKSNAAERAGKFDLANRLMVQAEKLEQTASPKENVVGAYLSIQKSYEFDASEQRFLDIQNEIHDAIREAKTGGYDGIVFRNLIDNADWGSERALDHWVAFEPTQIKSATGNVGTFDPKNPNIRYQAERVEGDKAMLPNGGYVPLAKLSKLQRIYREWLTTDRGVGQAIDRANEERIGKIMETAFDAPVTGKQLLKYFKENPSDDLRQAVFEALTGQRSIFELPADITGIVQKMREDVDALSRVIAQTAAPNDRLKAVIERNLGRYLGRHYKLFERKNWRPSNEVISRAKAKLREMHPNTIGKASSQELNGIIENIISKGDVTFHRGDRRIDIPQNHFVKRKDIPKEIRDLYGEITDPVWAYLKTMADQATVAHNADFLSKIAGMEGVFKDKPDETHFKQIPDVARWGAVRGKFTTQEVNDFLIEAIDPVDSGLFRFVEKLIVNPFKWTKTVASLPSHPRNFIGNTMFSVLAGNTITNPANIPYYWKALRVIMGKEGKYRGTWKELVRARVADTQFWGSEMPKLMAEMISDPVSWPDKIMNTVKWPVEKLGELYNNEDLIYRVSAFLKYRDNGMTVNQAAQEVDKWFTNYARLPKAVKTARRIGVFGPFLSFKANTARILINAAKESGEGIKKGNPAPALRLAFVVSFIPLLQMAMRTVFDIDDDEKKNLDKLQDMGPIYKRNSTPIYYRTAEGSIKAFDLGYIWPTGDFQKAAKASLAGDLESIQDTLDLFEHPGIHALSILFFDYNMRNRQRVANMNDPLPRRMADRMEEFTRQIYVPASSPVPSIRGLAKGRYEPGLLTGYQIKTLYDAYHGVEDRFGRTREVPEELRAFFTGIRTWEIRPDDTKKAFRMRKAGEFQEAKRELRRYMRMPGISQEEKERRMDDWKRRVAKIRSDVESSNSVKLK